MNKETLFREADAAYGRGDFKSAFDLFVRASEIGDVDSMSRIACMFFNGEGVKKDIEKSIYWDKKAIDNGSELSLCNLGITYQMTGDYKSAEVYFEKAIAIGDGDAAVRLAKLYIENKKDIKQIIELLYKAIKSKNIFDDSLQEAKQLLSSMTL